MFEWGERLYVLSRSVVPSSATSCVHGILQASNLEWVAIFSSRGSSQPRVKPASPVSPALQVDSLPTELLGKRVKD